MDVWYINVQFCTFDKASQIFEDHSNSMFNIQQYYTKDLCIVLYLNREKKLKAKTLTSSLL